MEVAWSRGTHIITTTRTKENNEYAYKALNVHWDIIIYNTDI